MTNNLQQQLFLLAMMLMATSLCHAATNEVAPVLHQVGGSRPAGMAGCFTAVGEGPFGQLYNPAALAVGTGAMIGVHHESNDFDVHQNVLAARVKLGMGSLGIAANSFQYGDIAYRDVSGQLTGESKAAKEISIQTGYGLAVAPHWKLGMNAKAFGVDVGPTAINGLVVDLGALVELGQGFTLAGVLKSVGSNYQNFNLPTTVQLATAFRAADNRLLLDSELDIAFSGSPSDFGIGAEYQIQSWLDARAGLKTSMKTEEQALTLLTAGLGFNLNRLSLDINFAQRGELGNELGLGIIYQFKQLRHTAPVPATENQTDRAKEVLYKERIEKLKKIKASAESEQEVESLPEKNKSTVRLDQAAYHLEAGREYERYGQYIDAIIEYKAALKIKPYYPAASQALAAARQSAKAKEQQQVVVKKTPTRAPASLQKLIRKYYEKGQSAYQQKDYAKAIEQLQLVLEMTKQHRQATDLLKKAKEALTSEMNRLEQEAKQARQEGNLAAEVVAYQKMLDLNPTNQTIKQQLKKASNKIPQEVERLYKVGLDFDAKQQFRKALTAFENVLNLQPAHVKAKDAVKNIKEKLIQTGQ